MANPILTLHTTAQGDRYLVVTQSLTWAEWRAGFLENAAVLASVPWANPLPAEGGQITLRGMRDRVRAVMESDTKHSGPGWFGCTMDAAERTWATGGHETFTRPVREALATLRAETHAPRVARHVAGAWDIPAVITGTPLPALARTSGPAPVRELEIAVSLTVTQRTSAIAPLCAQLARACADYALQRGALRASVVWASATASPGYIRRNNVTGKNASHMRSSNNAAISAALQALQDHASPWHAQWAAIGSPMFDAVAMRTRVFFDPLNLQELAAALSPSIARLHYVGRAGRAWAMNRDRLPVELDHISGKAYSVLIDADDPQGTARSMCSALDQC